MKRRTYKKKKGKHTSKESPRDTLLCCSLHLAITLRLHLLYTYHAWLCDLSQCVMHAAPAWWLAQMPEWAPFNGLQSEECACESQWCDSTEVGFGHPLVVILCWLLRRCQVCVWLSMDIFLTLKDCLDTSRKTWWMASREALRQLEVHTLCSTGIQSMEQTFAVCSIVSLSNSTLVIYILQTKKNFIIMYHESQHAHQQLEKLLSINPSEGWDQWVCLLMVNQHS